MSTVTLYKETSLRELSDISANETVILNLPLPAVDSSILASYTREDDLVDQNDYEDNYYLAHVATSGGFLTRSSDSHGFRNISWRILEKARVIELDVCDLTVSSADQKYHRIRLQSPMKIRDSCLILTEDKDTDNLVLDFITESGFLYTTSFSFQYFLQSCTRTPLTDSNASSWRTIKKPTTFEINKSILLKGISSLYVVVALSTGHLVALSRDSPLDILYCNQFSDPRASFSFNFAARLFGSSDKIEGYPNLSARSSISLAVSPDGKCLISLSINRSLRIYSLDSLNLLSESVLGSSDSDVMLTPQPYHSLAFGKGFTDPSGKAYFVSCLPMADSRFKLWTYDPAGKGSPESPILNDLGSNYEIDPVSPDSSSLWLVSDFNLIVSEDSLELWVVWKSDNTFSTRIYNIPTTGGHAPPKNQPWLSVDSTDIPNTDYIMFADTNSESESEHCIKKIFGPAGYSNKTIATALPIYCRYRGQESHDLDMDSSLSHNRAWLVEQVCKHVGSMVTVEDPSKVNLISNQKPVHYNQEFSAFETYRHSLELQWTRFDRLCQELERQGQEFLALSYDPASNTVFTLRASFLSLSRQCTNLELYYFNRSATPGKYAAKLIGRVVGKEPTLVAKLLQLLDCMNTFRQVFTHQVRYNLFLDLADDFSSKKHRYLTTDRMDWIYQQNLSNLGEVELTSLASAFRDIGHIDELVKVIYDEFFLESPTKRNATIGGITPSGARAFSDTLYQFCCVGRLVSIDIIALCLISTISEGYIDRYVQFYSKFSHVLRCITAVFEVENILYVKQSTVPSSTGSTLEFFFTQNPSPESDVSGIGLPSTVTNIWNQFTGTNGLAKASVQLYLLGYPDEAVAFANRYLPQEYFASLIRAHLLLLNGESSKGVALIESCSIGFAAGDIGTEVVDTELLSLLSNVYRNQEVFGRGFVAYYLAHSQACFDIKLYAEALRLAILASQNLDPVSEQTISVYSLLFQAAIKCQDFEEAYSAVTEIFYAKADANLLKQVVEQLGTVMTLNGHGERFCQYPFIGLVPYVEWFLSNQIQNKQGLLTIEELVPFYQLAYTWKLSHGDSRGAATIIYEQLQQMRSYRDESIGNISLQMTLSKDIAELYLSVQNTLKVIDEDKNEQWILAYPVQQGSKQAKRTVLFYKDIERQKQEHLKGLQEELQMIQD